MAEPGWDYFAPNVGGGTSRGAPVEMIAKRHGMSVTQYVRSMGRPLRQDIPFYRDLNIDSTEPETIALNVTGVQETYAEMPAPGHPPLRSTGGGALATLDDEERFTNHDKPSIEGTTCQVIVSGDSAVLTAGGDTSLHADFKESAKGHYVTVEHIFTSATASGTANFTITLDVGYKLTDITMGSETGTPTTAQWTFEKFVENPAAGDDYTLHTIDILTDSQGHNLYELDEDADFGATGGDDDGRTQLGADSVYIVESRVRTLAVGQMATESVSMRSFPRADPT